MANQFTFQGQVENLEIKTTKTGKEFAVFSLVAQEEGYKGEVKNIVVRMTAFGQTGTTIISAGEGAMIFVKGKLESREYNGKHYVDLKAMDVQEIEGGGDELPF